MSYPDWLSRLLGNRVLIEGNDYFIKGHHLTFVNGILRSNAFVSDAQRQTREAFGFKWGKRDTYEGETLHFMQTWLLEKYSEITDLPWFSEYGKNPIVLDAGCGAAASGLALFGPKLKQIRYLGVDVSSAVDIAKTRFEEKKYEAGFLQCDINSLPLPEECVDIVFSEGVLHHTDDTRQALGAIVKHLKVGGRALFYVYRKKGPLREFADDYIRDKLQSMTPEEGWDAIEPLSRLGKALGELDIEIDIPKNIDVLDIPAGRINLQRFFYWHVCKAFYKSEMTIDEMNHINFDWYAPKNARRHTIEEVKNWCDELHLDIEHERIEEAGITIIAKKLKSGDY